MNTPDLCVIDLTDRMGQEIAPIRAVGNHPTVGPFATRRSNVASLRDGDAVIVIAVQSIPYEFASDISSSDIVCNDWALVVCPDGAVGYCRPWNIKPCTQTLDDVQSN